MRANARLVPVAVARAALLGLALLAPLSAPLWAQASQLFRGHEPVLQWHRERIKDLGKGDSVEALLGDGTLKILVNPALKGEGDAAQLPRAVFEQPGGEPLPDAVAAALGARLGGLPASIHTRLSNQLINALNLLLPNRVELRGGLGECLDDSARDKGACMLLIADVVVGADDQVKDGLVLSLELRLLRVSVDRFAALPTPVSAVELFWSDRHEGRATLSGLSEDQVLESFDEAVYDALRAGLIPNLWGDPDLLETGWFRERAHVLGDSLHDEFAGDTEGQ